MEIETTFDCAVTLIAVTVQPPTVCVIINSVKAAVSAVGFELLLSIRLSSDVYLTRN